MTIRERHDALRYIRSLVGPDLAESLDLTPSSMSALADAVLPIAFGGVLEATLKADGVELLRELSREGETGSLASLQNRGCDLVRLAWPQRMRPIVEHLARASKRCGAQSTAALVLLGAAVQDVARRVSAIRTGDGGDREFVLAQLARLRRTTTKEAANAMGWRRAAEHARPSPRTWRVAALWLGLAASLAAPAAVAVLLVAQHFGGGGSAAAQAPPASDSPASDSPVKADFGPSPVADAPGGTLPVTVVAQGGESTSPPDRKSLSPSRDSGNTSRSDMPKAHKTGEERVDEAIGRASRTLLAALDRIIVDGADPGALADLESAADQLSAIRERVIASTSQERERFEVKRREVSADIRARIPELQAQPAAPALLAPVLRRIAGALGALPDDPQP